MTTGGDVGANIDLNTKSFAFLDRLYVLRRLNNAKLESQHLLCLTETSPHASMIFRQLAESIGQEFSKDGVPEF